MAVDEALMEAARRGEVTLRLYRWEPGCLSFGRNQTARGRYDGEAAAARGIDVVRRPTGGRSVFHHRELTYSVTAPADLWGGLKDAYLRINRALAAGLRRLGVEAEVAGGSGEAAPRPTVRACFRDPLPGEVTAEGRKLVGSAQWRLGGALLQHGSILLVNEQAVVEELRTGAADAPEVPAAGITRLLGREPGVAAMAEALAAGFAEEAGLPVVPGGLDPSEREAAEALRSRYEDPAWTWRR
jgi:lipoate-protein ligase A